MRFTFRSGGCVVAVVEPDAGVEFDDVEAFEDEEAMNQK
jgi:hypothetical protein